MSFVILVLIVCLIFYFVSSEPSKYKEAQKNRRNEEEQQNRREEWINVIEPKHRNAPNYPEDWIWRRKEVFLRAEGKCESCGMEVGRLAKASASGMKFIEPLLRGAHVHHIKKISEGGDHSLANLQLLCESCHALKHPDIEIRGMISKGQLRRIRGRRK
jgi:5-methylcytosine-specific restriction endonuclease McrA